MLKKKIDKALMTVGLPAIGQPWTATQIILVVAGGWFLLPFAFIAFLFLLPLGFIGLLCFALYKLTKSGGSFSGGQAFAGYADAPVNDDTHQCLYCTEMISGLCRRCPHCQGENP